ncbi:MAG: glycosyltransferase family A protein [Aliarcobacter sp.]|nr:glycosyltransferase family A protein [Aliarcobacter sp.]
MNIKKGLAGSLNTGLYYLSKTNFDGYVSIIDDDDIWEPEHLRVNYDITIQNNKADVVISGLRMIKNGIDSKEKNPYKFISQRFFNWQSWMARFEYFFCLF